MYVKYLAFVYVLNERIIATSIYLHSCWLTVVRLLVGDGKELFQGINFVDLFVPRLLSSKTLKYLPQIR